MKKHIKRKLVDKKRLVWDCIRMRCSYSTIKKVFNMQFEIHTEGQYYVVRFINDKTIELLYPKSEYALSAQFELKKDWTSWQNTLKK